MRYSVLAGLAGVYYAIGYRLTHLAFRHFTHVDPRPGHKYDGPSFGDIYEPDYFSAEGQRARLTALYYWWIGLIVLVVAFFLA